MKKSLLTPIVTLLLAMMLILSAGPVLAEDQGNAGEAEGTNPAIGWFQKQLDANELIFYSAIEELYKSGDFATGKASLNLTEQFTQEELKDYANGNVALAQAFLNGRDAFCQDYPEVFYVDFSKLTLRVGTAAGGRFEAYLNSGSNENYFAADYTEANVGAAIDAAEAEKASIISAIDPTKDPVEIVTAVHDALIQNMEYSYPTTEHPHVMGVGALVDGFSNCEGYSRSFKWILDELNIPSVLVIGIGKNSTGNSESHMWNLVQIDDNWYAVDVTWDDPMPATEATRDSVVNKYLLKGEVTLRDNHFASSRFSNGAKEFTYPALCTQDYGTPLDPVGNDLDTDLKITTSKEGGDTAENTSTKFTISYKNLSANEMAEEHLYYAYRFVNEEGVSTQWAPLQDIENNNKPYVNSFLKEKGTVQFCVTNLYTTEPFYVDDLELKGNHVVLSKNINVLYTSTYVSPPFIQKSTPILTRTIQAATTHYDVEYDDALVKVEEAADVTIKIENSAEAIEATVENVTTSDRTITTANGEVKTFTTVSFDFTPDSTYQGYANVYRLYPQNLVGVSSKKEPNSINISTNFPSQIQCPHTVAKGEMRNAFVVASPTLLINKGMDDMFEFKAGSKPNSLDIQLIASIPSKDVSEKIEGATPDRDNIKGSASYDLSLSCQGTVTTLKNGGGNFHLTVGVPYPKGFNYNENPDVQFKAYHYVLQDDGSYKAEELVCVITPQGLQIIANGFSPFTVVAVDKSATPPVGDSMKIINVSSSQSGGIVKTVAPATQNASDAETVNDVAVGLYTLEEGGSKTFAIQADEGYEIDKLFVNDVAVKEAAGKESYNYTFDAEKIEHKTSLRASFIAKTVKATEEENNFAPAPEPVIEEKPIDIKVSKIKVTTKDSAPPNVDPGSTLELNAQIEPEDATDKDFFWSSSDKDIATVDRTTGVVTGVSTGDVDIIATAKDGSGVSSFIKITVNGVPVESVTLSADKTALTVGETLTIKNEIKPATATDKTLVWSTSSEAIATVDPSTGVVKAIAKGKVTITATAQDGSGKSGSIEITVNEQPVPTPIPVETITLSADKTTLTVGETLTIKNEIKPATATNKTLDWSTSDDKIATVDSSTGIVKALAKGEVTITATAQDGSGKSDSIEITVSEQPVPTPIPVETITLSADKTTLTVGETLTIKNEIKPATATDKTLVWSTSSEAIATVDPSTGVVKALAKGKVTITATAQDGSGKSGSIEITVNEQPVPTPIPVETIALSADKTTLTVGETLTIKYKIEPENATDKTLVWSTSSEAIATVEPSTGVVKALAKGEVTIKATAKDGSGKSGSIKITVNEQPVPTPIKSITLSADKTTLTVGEILTIKNEIKPDTATNKTLEWSTSDDRIATVDSSTGVVKALAKGEVTIKATAKDGSGKSGSIKITVNEQPVPTPIKSITLSADKTTLTVGDTLTIKHGIKPDTATNKTLEWSTSDDRIATVDSSTGVVKALSKGEVTIKATAKDGSKVFGTLKLTIKDKTTDPVNPSKPTTDGSETNTKTGAKSVSTGLMNTSNLPFIAVVILILCGLGLLVYNYKRKRMK